MLWLYILLGIVGVIALFAILSVVVIWWLTRQRLYRLFFLLRNRRKLVFLWLLLRDPRVPLYVKLLPLLAVAYWAMPIDFIPLIFLDDIAVALLILALVMKLTPQEVVEDLLWQAEGVQRPTPARTPLQGHQGQR